MIEGIACVETQVKRREIYLNAVLTYEITKIIEPKISTAWKYPTSKSFPDTIPRIKGIMS